MTSMRPKGIEAQCPTCDRLFGSDSTCEKHKPYAKPVTVICKDPAQLGMEARIRQGRTVWVRPAPEALKSEWRKEREDVAA